MHEGDEMCLQRRYNLSPATNCAGVTKCAVTQASKCEQSWSHIPSYTHAMLISMLRFLQNLLCRGQWEHCISSGDNKTYCSCSFLLLPWQKEVMFLVALVCLSVCLFVDNITQKVMNGLG